MNLHDLKIGTKVHVLDGDINRGGEGIPTSIKGKFGVIIKIRHDASYPFRVDFNLNDGNMWACCLEDFDYVVVGNKKVVVQ